jgi:phosphoribosylformimino-5-aminoimidazole carboxamide ribotide isomerase
VIVIPAIDLRAGRCVRLFRGDPGAETVYDDDPIETAERFEQEGARRLHVVDLDAARGEGSNRDVVVRILRKVAIPVQVGGGLRTLADVDEVLARGGARAILGTSAALDPGFVSEAVHHAGDRVVVAVDVRDERVMVRGWREEGPRLAEAVAALTDVGAPRFLVTAIERDGTMDGPDVELYERLVASTPVPIIASGGVRSADDVRALRDVGVEAAVVGKALYSGTLRLADVIRG